MELKIEQIKEHFKGRWTILVVMLLGVLLCTYFAAQEVLPLAAAICVLPIAFVIIGVLIHRPVILFVLLFVVNYLINGATRYVHIPVPISIMFDALYIFLLFFLAISLIRGKMVFKQEVIPFLLLYGFWIGYCLIEAFNNTIGLGFQFGAWFKEVRPLAFHALYVILIFTLLFNKQKHIKYFLYLWGVFILLAAAKGYLQRNRGFDPYEWQWLWSGGATTHLIHSGVRYFSFFSDAANFGSNMAFSLVTYAICFLYEKEWKAKLYFLIVAIAGGYGMMISGTRSALLVAIAGFLLYTLLAKNIKLFIMSTLFLVATVGVLKYTTIGDSNRLIHRMRTAFDPEDASLQVRLTNQKAIKSYMSEAPWGIGIGMGMGADQLPQNNKYWIVSVTAPDSTLVYIWMRTGAIGILVFLFVLCMAVAAQCFIVLFKIKDPQLRGMLTAFTCGGACMIVAAYGNFIYHQYPNTLLVWGLQTLVFMGPYFDKQIAVEKEKKALESIELNKKDLEESDI